MTVGHGFLSAGIALCVFSFWAIARHDWLRLTRPGRRALAEVTGHRSQLGGSNARQFAALYSFTDASGQHQVIDQLYSSTPHPPLGTLRELTYPEGRPDLARPPRPLLWLAVYAMIIGLCAVLLAKWFCLLAD